ncbi:MAG: hydrolase [Haloarculaceae archaeon]
MSLEWSGAAVESVGGRPSPESWEPVDVPGRPAAFAGADAVAYRTEFPDPRERGETHVVLECRGVYAHASVWLNGERIAEHDAYFEPLCVPLPVADENELLVTVRRPEDRFGGMYDTDRLPAERCVPGIWWGASVETYPDPYLAALDARPALGDEDAAVEATATVVTDDPLEDRVTFSLRPEGEARGGGMMNRGAVETEGGRTTVTQRLDVRDPSLWWPHDLGDQPRYTVRASLGDHERTTTTGLRSVEYGPDGLVVNGERVTARGVNLVDATPEDVTRAVRANANLVRAHAHALPPDVYEACDEQGVLVWQDLPLTGPGGFDVDRGCDLAERLVAAYGRHPSLAAVGVHDDPVPAYADGLGSGVLDRLRYRFRAWRTSYDRTDADSVAAAIDEVPAFPVVGPAGVDPDAATLYPGWEFGAPSDADWLCDRYGVGDVVAEFGAGALAGDAGAADVPDFDRARHDARVADGIDASQAYQADVVGRVAERLRLCGADVLAAYALRDAGAAGMGVLARDGTEKAAYERLAAAYRPLQVVLADPTAGESEVVVLNDRPTGGTATVEWDVDGEREQTDVSVDAHDRATATTLSLDGGVDVTLAVALDDAVAHNEYDLSASYG